MEPSDKQAIYNLMKNTPNYQDYFRLKPEIDCPYENDCIRYPSESCRKCKHNRKRIKKDYFEPDPPRPWIPQLRPDRYKWWLGGPYECQKLKNQQSIIGG